MLHPNGPERREVYLRRRVAVAGGAVAVVLAGVWLISGLGGGQPEQQPVPAGANESMTSEAPPSATEASPTPSATGVPPTPGASATPPASSPGRSSVSAKPAAPALNTALCSDNSLDIAAQVAAPSYAVGAQPVFRILLTNTGQSACSADLGDHLQRVLVYSANGGQRVWSSDDCSPSDAAQVRTLQPGEQAVYSVQWSAATSAAGCAGARQPVSAGNYQVIVALGARQSSPVPFTIA